VVSHVHLFARDKFKQLSFRSQGGLSINRKADPGSDPEDMRVNGHIGLIVNNGGDHVGGLAADAGETNQFFDCQGHLATKVIDQHLGHTDEVPCLIIGIRNAADKREQAIKIRFGQAGGVREFLKNSRRGHVDPLIGALSRQDNRYQELVWAVVKQLSSRVGIVFAEIV